VEIVSILPQTTTFATEAEPFDLRRLKRVLIEPDEPELRRLAYFLARQLSTRLGRFLHVGCVDTGTDPIDCLGLSTKTRKVFLGPEGYDLDVKKELGFVSALSPLGIARGIQTLLEIVREDAPFPRLPAVRAIDKPRLPWRAVRLDASQAPPPIEWLERFLDLLAMLRLGALRIVLPCGDRPSYPREDLERLVARANELDLELVPEPIGPAADDTFFAVVRLIAKDGEERSRAAAERFAALRDTPIPTVDWIYALDTGFGLPRVKIQEPAQRVIGLEAWIRPPAAIDLRLVERAIVTRLAAFAELAWTPPERRSFPEFRERLGGFFRAVDRLGFDYDVPPPLGAQERLEFDDEVAVELIAPVPDAVVRYSLDGSEPGADSPVADRPLFLTASGTLKARTFLRNGKSSQSVVAILVRRA
jgi:N-acetyl-beta-hexosaminidase